MDKALLDQYYCHVILSYYYRVLVALRDYKMTESHCQVMTHYGGNKFGNLGNVAVGGNDEILIVDHTNKCVIVLDCNFALLALIGQESGDSRFIG